MPRRERDLYRYRPEDTDAQRRDRERMRERREQELKDISERWDESLKGQLTEVGRGELPDASHPARRRRRRTPLGRALHRVAKAIGLQPHRRTRHPGAHRKE